MPVYALGSNGSGQLGLGHEEDVSIPSLVDIPNTLKGCDIKSIVAGGNHTLLLTKYGEIYASGSNSDGRCGLQSKTQLLSIERIDLPEKVMHCAATWEASFFATVNHRILVCGAGSKGELGLGPDQRTVHGPTEIPDFPPTGTTVVDLTACMGHVVAVLSNGQVYGWGTGRQGQIGETAEDVWRPRRIENLPFEAARAVCGKDFTCLLSGTGDNDLVLLGLSKRDKYSLKSSIPSQVTALVDVQASWGSLILLLSAGEMLGFGRDDHGQLPPPNLPKVTAMAAGSEHVLALTAAGEVSAWGWGEHGNCSVPLDKKSDVSGHWNVLQVPGTVLALGAGCATSWIITGE